MLHHPSSIVGAITACTLNLLLGCTKGAPPTRPSTDAASSGKQHEAITPDSGAGLGASFDCRKAATKIERLICDSPELSRLDGELAVAYEKALAGYRNRGLLRDSQRAWLGKTRNKAAGAAELREAYRTRLARLNDDIERGQEVVRGELAWRMMVYDDEVALPMITRWPDARAKTRINAVLEKLGDEMNCGEPDYKFRTRSEVGYAEHDIFSVELHASYFCGGPYPTIDSNRSTTFDLRTGVEVPFANLFSRYDRKKAAVLEAIFDEAIAHSEHSEFTLNNISYNGVAFSFHEDGLHVQPTFPHVFETHAEVVVVPYARLRRFAAPGGLLARIPD